MFICPFARADRCGSIIEMLRLLRMAMAAPDNTNGRLVNDWPTTGAAIGQGQPMVVGAWPPFYAYNFQGSIDEFRIYGRSLTQQEVQALYDQGR